jgi:hypothetical protein
MGILYAIVPLIIIIVIFFFVVKVATVILKLTGMDEKTARFQAISAFTGTGFTTAEAELMLENDMRRRTVTVLMILGKVGIISMITGLFLSFSRDDLMAALWKVSILIIVIFVLYKITAARGFGRTLNRFIEKRLIAGGIVRQRALEEVFQLPKGYGIAQLTITKDTEEKGLTLADAGFIKKNILVLSIERENTLISFPRAEDAIKENDKLLCYGLLENIKSYA